MRQKVVGDWSWRLDLKTFPFGGSFDFPAQLKSSLHPEMKENLGKQNKVLDNGKMVAMVRKEKMWESETLREREVVCRERVMMCNKGWKVRMQRKDRHYKCKCYRYNLNKYDAQSNCYASREWLIKTGTKEEWEEELYFFLKM